MHLCSRPGCHQNLYQPTFCLLTDEPDSHLTVPSALCQTHSLLAFCLGLRRAENFINKHLSIYFDFRFILSCLLNLYTPHLYTTSKSILWILEIDGIQAVWNISVSRIRLFVTQKLRGSEMMSTCILLLAREGSELHTNCQTQC